MAQDRQLNTVFLSGGVEVGNKSSRHVLIKDSIGQFVFVTSFTYRKKDFPDQFSSEAINL
jgi:hypothetical protein